MEPGWTSGSHAVNGVTLHVVEAGPANGPLLILLHGFPEFWWGWHHQISPLAEHGYHVVVPDMRGYNASSAPHGIAAYRLETLSADILALADSFGADRFRLVGHDWGGVVAWDLGARAPGRVERLVVMNAPHPDLWISAVLNHPTQALRSTYAAFFQIPWLPEAVLRAFRFATLRAMVRRTARPGTFGPGEMARYVDAWSHPGSLTAMLNYYRALRKLPIPDQPRRITPPTLILWGEKDSALEQHIAHDALGCCDDGDLTFVSDTTHWLHHEAPERVNRKLIAFLGD
jgi:pimeloyl-ACP methyl ester carboxylesterase